MPPWFSLELHPQEGGMWAVSALVYQDQESICLLDLWGPMATLEEAVAEGQKAFLGWLGAHRQRES